jgi:hypothetical protein
MFIFIFFIAFSLMHAADNEIIRARCFLVDNERAISDLCALTLNTFEQRWNHNAVHYLLLLNKKDTTKETVQTFQETLIERLQREAQEYSWTNLLRKVGKFKAFPSVSTYIDSVNNLICPEVLWDDKNFPRYTVTGALPENAYGIQVMQTGKLDPSQKTKIKKMGYAKVCETQNNSLTDPE